MQKTFFPYYSFQFFLFGSGFGEELHLFINKNSSKCKVDNRDSKKEADSVLPLSLWTEYTCSRIKLVSPADKARLNVNVCLCVCVHQSNHYNRLVPNTPICQDKQVTGGEKVDEMANLQHQPKKKGQTVLYYCGKWVLSTNGPSISFHIDGLVALDLSSPYWKQWSEKGARAKTRSCCP